MDKADIYKQLDIIFRDIFDDDSISLTPDSNSSNIEGWDSLMHVNIIVSVEAHFKIKFKTSEIEAMQKIDHLTDAIAKKLER